MNGIIIYNQVEIVRINQHRNFERINDPNAVKALMDSEEVALARLNELLETKRYTILKVISIPLEGRGNTAVEYHLARVSCVAVAALTQSYEAEDFEEPERDEGGKLKGDPIQVIDPKEE